MVKVRLTMEAREQVENVPISIRGRVLHIVDRLSKWPAVSGYKPLRGKLHGSYRIRTGSYRVLFRIEGTEITIWRIENRRDVYE